MRITVIFVLPFHEQHGETRLGQYLLDHVSMNIRETSPDAVVVEAEFLVIESQKMQDRGVKVVCSNGVLLGAKSKLVSCAVTETFPNSRTCEPASEPVGVVITSKGARLEHRHAAKLGRKHDER